MENINTELLIKLVEERPALWDKTVDIYKNRHAKDTAWREICTQLHEDFETMKERERHVFRKLVLKKWTYIRDAWGKSLKKLKDQKASGTTKPLRLYTYHGQMSFLLKIMDPITMQETTENFDYNNESSINDDDDSYYSYDSNIKNEVIPEDILDEQNNREIIDKIKQPVCKSSNFEPRKKSIDEVDAKFIELMDHSIDNYKIKREEDGNRHLSFFRSLLPSLAAFNDDETLQFQANVISLVQNMKAKRSPEFHTQIDIAQLSKGSCSNVAPPLVNTYCSEPPP